MSKKETISPEQFQEGLQRLLEMVLKNYISADEFYVLGEGESEDDIPDNATVVVFPNLDAEVIDWTNYYNKAQINEIIRRADFKKGKSAYEVAVENGFEGDENAWLLSLKGKSAYEIAIETGLFEGSVEEWVMSLNGEDGYTPQKGVDYFDGYTPQKGIDYVDGYTPQKGVDYNDGYTPQRDVDYWTEADKNEIYALIRTFIDIELGELVGSSPDALDTLWELANALGNDPNFATTVLNKIGQRVEKVEGKGLSTNDYTTAEKEKLAGLQNLPLISNKGYTNGAVWYFPLGKMVIDDSGNFGNFTINGRIGGWVNNNSAVYSIMLMNRADYTGNIITSTVSASGEVANALPICDIVVSKNSDKSHTVYLKCQGYFLFNFEWSAYQHSIIYDGSYITTEPSNIVWRLSTAPKTVLSSTGVMFANGKELIDKDTVQTMLNTLETKIANEYLGGKKFRFANDSGLDGYVTIKKG